MWTMGDDFQYQYAESWFKQMDKFIHYVNKVLYAEGLQLSGFNHSNTFLIELKISPLIALEYFHPCITNIICETCTCHVE